MPRHLSAAPSCLEFMLDTEQPLSVLYHEESQIGINKQETQQRGTLSAYWKLARVSKTAASILQQARTQIFHNTGDSAVKPARVQSCRHTGIYTQPLLQGLIPAFPHSLGGYQGTKVQGLPGFPAHPSHADPVEQCRGFGRQ